MSERGGLLVGLVMAGLVLSIGISVVLFAIPRFSTNQTDLDNFNDGTITGPLKQAESVKIKADLKAVSTNLIAYYAENGHYPTSLTGLASSMGISIDTTNIIYEKCSSVSVAFYYNSQGYPGYIHESTQVRSVSDSAPPSCY
jgi:hypothetical protein